ncbi:serine/threonine-protein kinase [Planctomycetes bacterium K23_9]|uniref:non-specific serine/threonine protein kinase n=1 Tax=Stieleria marina TaxID=1930275 RepID=A0A517NQB6_9BACT|nr:Serine/threonine-protein kinase PrkC [Planctomycetes bacterium K23_9]
MRHDKALGITMINRTMNDSLDEAIDQFEENWTPDSRSTISPLLTEHGLKGDHDALTELIRIDIELRYKHGLSLKLNEYFEQWNDLLDRPANVADIAFEDFRARSAHGHDIFVSRWRDLPGVKDEQWFQRLVNNSPRPLPGTGSIRPFSGGTPTDANGNFDSEFREAIESSGFQIVHEIATGAFSKVYLATQLELADRYVVLKVVDDDLRESRSMAMLQHTNIVPLYSVHRIHSRTVICMPYAGSVTLNDVLGGQADDESSAGQSLIDTVEARIDKTMSDFQQDSFPQSLSLAPAADEQAALKPLESLRHLDRNALTTWIFVRLASALAHSHARGILHGDLKPSNVLIRNDGEPALLDFNLAQSLNHNLSRVVGGTLPYMAPESYRSFLLQESEAVKESDIYALGVMMFQFVTGRLPHTTPPSMAPTDLQRAIEERKQPPAWQASDEVSASLKCVINRCLEFSGQQRYTSAEDLRIDLENENASRSLAIAEEPIGSRVKKWLRRNPQLTSAGTVAALLLAISIPPAYVALQWRQTSQQMMVAERSRDFLAQSAATLMRINADPARESLRNIEDGIEVLRSNGLFDPDGYTKLISSQASPPQRTEMLESVQRHALQIGRLEARRLWVKSTDTRLADSDFQRLDQLIAAAEYLPLPGDSRSLFFLKARRASLGRDSSMGEYLQKAEQTAAVTDSERYLEAVRLMTQHKHRQAMQFFNTLNDSKIVPSVSLWTLKARSQYADEQYENAKLSLTRSILHAPDSSDLHVLRGRCHQRLGKRQFALLDFDKAIELDPNNVRAWNARATNYLNWKKYKEAIKDYSEVQRRSPGNVFSLVKRAKAHEAMGHSELAAKDLEAAKQSSELSVDALVSRALAIDEQEPLCSLADLQRALQLDPDNPMILRNIAKVYSVNLKQYPESIEAFDQSLKIEPTNERALIDRAIQYARLARFDEAIGSLELAIQEPNDPRTYYQAACTYALMPGKVNHQRGLMFLAKAVHAGYEVKRFDDDEDLNNLRSLEGYKHVRTAYSISRRSRTPNPTRSQL